MSVGQNSIFPSVATEGLKTFRSSSTVDVESNSNHSEETQFNSKKNRAFKDVWNDQSSDKASTSKRAKHNSKEIEEPHQGKSKRHSSTMENDKKTAEKPTQTSSQRASREEASKQQEKDDSVNSNASSRDLSKHSKQTQPPAQPTSNSQSSNKIDIDMYSVEDTELFTEQRNHYSTEIEAIPEPLQNEIFDLETLGLLSVVDPSVIRADGKALPLGEILGGQTMPPETAAASQSEGQLQAPDALGIQTVESVANSLVNGAYLDKAIDSAPQTVRASEQPGVATSLRQTGLAQELGSQISGAPVEAGQVSASQVGRAATNQEGAVLFDSEATELEGELNQKGTVASTSTLKANAQGTRGILNTDSVIMAKSGVDANAELSADGSRATQTPKTLEAANVTTNPVANTTTNSMISETLQLAQNAAVQSPMAGLSAVAKEQAKNAITESTGTELKTHSVDSTALSQAHLNNPILARQAAMQATIPFSQNNTQWFNAIAERVMWMSSQNIQTAELKLDPSDLGPIQVRVSVNQDQASVSFISHHASVREALDLNAMRLRDMFENEGLSLVNVDVSDSSQQHAQQQDQNNLSATLVGAADMVEDTDSKAAVIDNIQLVDYYV